MEAVITSSNIVITAKFTTANHLHMSTILWRKSHNKTQFEESSASHLLLFLGRRRATLTNDRDVKKSIVILPGKKKQTKKPKKRKEENNNANPPVGQSWTNTSTRSTCDCTSDLQGHPWKMQKYDIVFTGFSHEHRQRTTHTDSLENREARRQFPRIASTTTCKEKMESLSASVNLRLPLICKLSF